MAFLLVIDTALERGGVGLFRDGLSLGILVNDTQKDHAAFVQSAIDQLVRDVETSLALLDAVAVVDGPGSYTGLRVGLATAKGLCYALDKKLILVNTLNVMAAASIKSENIADCYYAPMIDARREDVFAGVYNHKRQLVSEQQALTIEPETFQSFSSEKKLVLSGSGAAKASKIIASDNVSLSEIQYTLDDVNEIAQEKFAISAFADVAYSEPNYLKAFYTTAKKVN